MKAYQYYIITSLILYLFSYIYYILISKGLGNKATYLQMRRFIPCAILAVLPAALAQMPLTSPAFIVPTFIALMWILTYPTLYYIDNHKVSSDFEYHFEAVFGLYFIGLITSLSILASQIPDLAVLSATIITIVEAIFLFIPVAQIIYYLLYKSCINETGMQMLQETHYNETIEFFKSMPVHYNLGSLIFIIASTYYIFSANYNALALHHPLPLASLALISVLAIFFATYLFKPNHGVFVRTAIVEFYLNIKRHLEQNMLYTENQKKRLQELEVTLLGEAFDKPSTIILVIGESASRDYMKAFNEDYKYETTPWLSKQKLFKNFTLFPNSYACFRSTAIALSRALTEFNQYDNNEFFTSCSIVDIAHKLGYKVHWYSNQGHLGAASTAVSIVAETSDVAKWTQQELNKVQYDEELLGFLDEVDPAKNNFVILHLKGSHFNYQNRYPENFTKFGEAGKYNLEDNYANSIAYTDNFLNKAFDYAKQKLNLQAMVYCADHADIPDSRRSPNFEGLAHVRIPMFTYLSDEYIAKNSTVYETLKTHQEKHWTNDLLYELICGIFNIKSNKFKEENSLASTKFKFKREDLLVNGEHHFK